MPPSARAVPGARRAPMTCRLSGDVAICDGSQIGIDHRERSPCPIALLADRRDIPQCLGCRVAADETSNDPRREVVRSEAAARRRDTTFRMERPVEDLNAGLDHPWLRDHIGADRNSVEVA